MIDGELERLEDRVHRAKHVLAEKTDAMKEAKSNYTEACNALAMYKAITTSKLGRLGTAECNLIKLTSGETEVHVRVALPWGALTWDGRIYTSHPAFYISGRIESTELGDVIAHTGVAIRKHHDEIKAQLAALEKTMLDGLKSNS